MRHATGTERSKQKQAWKQTKRSKKRKQKGEEKKRRRGKKKEKKRADTNINKFKRGENDQPVCF